VSDPLTLDGRIFGGGQPCFGCAPDHPIGFRLAFTCEGEEVRTTFMAGEQHQGPPGVMHGGLVMTLADEIAAWTVIGLKQRMGFTAAVEARLLKPVRIASEIVGRGRIASDGARVVKVAVELEQSGAACFRGDFSFALLDQKGAERVIGGPLPEWWKRFAR
jgi:acyl-coenzyme A thioesterase PaaI-like protein